jgi:valyl-tRNA synthetase
LLETGHDIIFFWVARMVMMSLELTDKLPFTTVFLHPMVKDENGAKMSKSKGNVIDPLEVMDGCTLDVILKKLYESNLAQKEIDASVADKKKKFP